MLVQPVVCLAGEGAQLPVQQSTSATRVVALDGLLPLVASGPVRLLPGEIDALAEYLTDQLGGIRSPSLVTTATLLSPSTASAHEPPHRTRRALAGRPSRAAPPRWSADITPRVPPSPGRPEPARRVRPNPFVSCLSQLLRVGLVLTLMWVLLVTMPTWVPVVSGLISDVLLQPMLDSVSTPAPSAPSPSPGSVP